MSVFFQGCYSEALYLLTGSILEAPSDIAGHMAGIREGATMIPVRTGILLLATVAALSACSSPSPVAGPSTPSATSPATKSPTSTPPPVPAGTVVLPVGKNPGTYGINKNIGYSLDQPGGLAAPGERVLTRGVRYRFPVTVTNKGEAPLRNFTLTFHIGESKEAKANSVACTRPNPNYIPVGKSWSTWCDFTAPGTGKSLYVAAIPTMATGATPATTQIGGYDNVDFTLTP